MPFDLIIYSQAHLEGDYREENEDVDEEESGAQAQIINLLLAGDEAEVKNEESEALGHAAVYCSS